MLAYTLIVQANGLYERLSRQTTRQVQAIFSLCLKLQLHKTAVTNLRNLRTNFFHRRCLQWSFAYKNGSVSCDVRTF